MADVAIRDWGKRGGEMRKSRVAVSPTSLYYIVSGHGSKTKKAIHDPSDEKTGLHAIYDTHALHNRNTISAQLSIRLCGQYNGVTTHRVV